MAVKVVRYPCPTFLVSKNTTDSHQRNPSWVVAFVRFEEPASIYGQGVKDLQKTKDRISVIENDCIDVQISNSKGSFGKLCSLSMKVGEIYYPNLVANGDWVFVWMVDYQDDADRITKLLLGNTNGNGQLNDWQSGLKFAGRIIEVGDTQQISSNGRWNLVQSIRCQSFLEFATSVYHTYLSKAFVTPYAGVPTGSTDSTTSDSAKGVNQINQDRLHNDFLVHGVKDLDDKYISLYESSQAKLSPDDVVQFFFTVIFGVSKDIINASNKSRGAFSDAVNVPQQVGMILNQPNAKKLWELYSVYLGIQDYAPSSGKNTPWEAFNPIVDESLSTGFNVNPDTVEDVFFRSNKRCTGWVPFFPPQWDNVNSWEFLNRYINGPFNEMYTALRCNHFNQIVPTLIVREVPLGTNLYDYLIPGKAIDLKGGTQGENNEVEEAQRLLTDIEKQVSTQQVTDSHVTRESSFTSTSQSKKADIPRAMYHKLPRWLIDRSMLIGVNTSTTETNRVNMVQVFGTIPGAQMGLQNFSPELYKNAVFVQGNFIVDDADIARNGLRAVILESPFDDPSAGARTFGLSQHWARMKADHLFNGHLKSAGTIQLHGCRWPIVEGDNVQVNGIVYHINGVSHKGGIDASGNKQFLTTLSVSNGILASSLTGDQKKLPSYPVHRTLVRRDDPNWKDELPGATDVQRNIKSNRTPDGENK